MISVDVIDALAERIGYRFSSEHLLVLALTHRSWCAENDDNESNERLEFLGDAVLGMAVAEHTYACFPELAEGDLAKLRASVVSAVALAEVAADLRLGPALRLGKGEEASGGASKQSILADAMEAVIGAVYVDGGWPAARQLVLELVGDRIITGAQGPGVNDHKTRLQELTARRFEVAPRYEVTSEGPDHDKTFTAQVRVAGDIVGSGVGGSKKEAEQAAAREAWTVLGDQP